MIILKAKDGTTREVEVGKPYRLQKGEMVVGSSNKRLDIPLELQLNKEGIQWGDAIAWVTKQMGMKQCAPCQARQRILNSIKKLGLAETIRQIKETL